MKQSQKTILLWLFLILMFVGIYKLFTGDGSKPDTQNVAWLKTELTTEDKAKNIEKAKLLYDFLDASRFFRNPVAKEDRSRMNVPFTLAKPDLDPVFLKGAEARGMVQLKGHRSVGGMRASIYNAMPIEGVQRLVAYMREFEKTHG